MAPHKESMTAESVLRALYDHFRWDSYPADEDKIQIRMKYSVFRQALKEECGSSVDECSILWNSVTKTDYVRRTKDPHVVWFKVGEIRKLLIVSVRPGGATEGEGTA